MASAEDIAHSVRQARALADVMMAVTQPHLADRVELEADSLHRMSALQYELLAQVVADLSARDR